MTDDHRGETPSQWVRRMGNSAAPSNPDVAPSAAEISDDVTPEDCPRCREATNNAEGKPCVGCQ